MVSPAVPSKLADLNSLSVYLEDFPFGWGFDCSSLASMFGASFLLVTFISHVSCSLSCKYVGTSLWCNRELNEGCLFISRYPMNSCGMCYFSRVLWPQGIRVLLS